MGVFILPGFRQKAAIPGVNGNVFIILVGATSRGAYGENALHEMVSWSDRSPLTRGFCKCETTNTDCPNNFIAEGFVLVE